MKRFMSHFALRLGLVAILSLGLATLGFAHRTANHADSDLAAFLDAGGTLADLCQDATPGPLQVETGCDACRLIAAAHAPGPVLVPANSGFADLVQHGCHGDLRAEQTAYDPSRAVRAPPLV